MRIRTCKFVLLSLTFILLFTMVKTNEVVAQDGEVGETLYQRNWVEFDEQGRQFIRQREDGLSIPINTQSNIDEPDIFGYTWDETVPLEWIDAKSLGEKLILSNDHIAHNVDIGFSFPFYENVFNSINVGEPGILSFDELGDMRNYYNNFPWPEEPNNTISPYWRPSLGFFPEDEGNIYIYRAGSSPNRYTVIEWYELKSGLLDYPGVHTFQVVLYENGDIKFQYKQLEEEGNFGFNVGVEDSRGIIGLGEWKTVSMLNGKAILIERPNPSKRVVISPFREDVMAIPGKQALYKIEIINNGDMGEDTYQITSASAWPIQLFEEDGSTPLPDTMTIAQADSRFAWARVDIPAGAVAADENEATVTATSAINPDASFTAKLVQFIPGPFTSVYNKETTSNAHLIWPSAQNRIILENNADSYSEPIIRELPGQGYVVFFFEDSSETSQSIRYQLFNRVGVPFSDPKTLVHVTDGSTLDYPGLVAAVSQDNAIHVSWVKWEYRDGYNFNRANVWSAILDNKGEIKQHPRQITNYNEWFIRPDYQAIYYIHAKPIGINKVLTLWQFMKEVGGQESSELLFRITDDHGNVLVNTKSLTENLPPVSMYIRPQPIQLKDGRILLIFESRTKREDGYSDWDYYYMIFDEFGSILETNPNQSYSFAGNDITILEDGKIALAYRDINIVDPTTFVVVSRIPRKALDHPTAGEFSASSSPTLIALDDGNLLVVWHNYSYKALLYAVVSPVSPVGTVLSGPYVIDKGKEAFGYSSYGAVRNTWEPQPGVDMVVHNYFDLYPAAPGGTASLRVQFSNLGLDTGTNSTLTLTLPEGLSYVFNDSGLEPHISGNQIIWNFGDTAFSEFKEFNIVLKAADYLPIDTTLNVGTLIETDQPDTNPADNGESVKVWVSIPIYFPIGLR